jgi:hypothetical protein
MTRDQFRELAEIWGGDIDRWPPATQGPARELAADEQCRRILGEQLQLDRLLSIAPDVSDDRAGRAGFAVLQKVAHPDRNRAWLHRWLRRSSLFPAATFACSAILGLWLAAAIPYPQHQEALSVVSMVFDSSDAGLWGVP